MFYLDKAAVAADDQEDFGSGQKLRFSPAS